MAFVVLISTFIISVLACDGGMALKKTISIPVGSPYSNGMTEVVFKNTLKGFENFFGPLVDRDHNAELQIYGSWQSNTVNAFAEQAARKYRITILGGLARHKAITVDGLVATLCHELGHHLGGYPKKQTNRWSSAEGQADYYATMKCLRKIWARGDNLGALRNTYVPEVVKLECARTYPRVSDQVLCQRMAMAGKSVALMIQDLDHDSIEPKFETPDELVVRTINYMHPFSQCRLDTYFQGSLCGVSESIEFDDHDQTRGACHSRFGHTRGLRPRCWFVPRN